MNAIDVLLAEDNRGDVRLIERAFEDRDLPATLRTARTGEEALDGLYRRGAFADAPRPELVLLDLNLPVTSGRIVLEEIRSEPALGPTPVVVLTGSASDDDLVAAYEAAANACLRKPVDPVAFADRIEAVVRFWQSTAILPPTAGNDGNPRTDDENLE